MSNLVERKFASRQKAVRFKRAKKKTDRGNSLTGMYVTNAHGGIERRKVTANMRRARRKSGRRLKIISGRSSTLRKIRRTKRKHKNRGIDRVGVYSESMGGVLQHAPWFIEAVTEFARIRGDHGMAAAILESTDPRLTSTPIGIAAMDLSDHVENTPSVNKQFIDVSIIDEKTVAIYFSGGESINEGAIERSLSEFGTVKMLAKPGDELDEGEVSDLYMFAVEFPEENLSDSVDGDEDEDEYTDEDDDSLEESLDQLCNHPCFDEAGY